MPRRTGFETMPLIVIEDIIPAGVTAISYFPLLCFFDSFEDLSNNTELKFRFDRAVGL